ncbi:hypothetical protein POVCU1_022100 [Plasmodium ovale curtisi]|uniref:Uncharacterized protein n=1 Tax=Plasmodium ovale curtisi TaxID=864141 RepID=A0A1A8WGS7_PLAOA|nr:hypothetical protein POVCU1_022100 [Plasmodium ovale curtisi]
MTMTRCYVVDELDASLTREYLCANVYVDTFAKACILVYMKNYLTGNGQRKKEKKKKKFQSRSAVEGDGGGGT